MGVLVNGSWQQQASLAEKATGEYKRQRSQFTGSMTQEKLSKGDYVLVISAACPWCHRVMILRAMYGLEACLPVVEVQPLMLENGWELYANNMFNLNYVHQMYTATQNDYSGRVTVPLIWDKEEGAVICNESEQIINDLLSISQYDGPYPWVPVGYEASIDEWVQKIYETVNNGVYRAGFATKQSVYEQAFDALFATLDEIEAHLNKNTYLCGEKLTKADWYLFVTLIRFDLVYYTHFKCCARRIEDYANLSAYVRELYQTKGVALTVNFQEIKQHYFGSHRTINPQGIIPKGPAINWLTPHGRFTEYF